MQIEVVDAMPSVNRNNVRISPETQRLREALLTGKVNVIRNIDHDKEYGALQQRIRQAGKAVGLKVRIVTSRNEDTGVSDIYFEGYESV
jgi:hypothetical protein